MGEQVQKRRRDTRPAAEATEASSKAEADAELAARTEELLDEIDELIGEEELDLARHYSQKGGQ